MIKAVIFDMFETLITHYAAPLYFSAQMAQDAGILTERFQTLWHSTEEARTIGRMTFQEALSDILHKEDCYSETLLIKLTAKRMAVKEECFEHLHPEIIPMLLSLKERGILLGLISNCFSEEAEVIRRSILLPYFDGVFLSWEQGVQKPEKEIYERCTNFLKVKPEECIYVGDGGSHELEAAKAQGMRAYQAVWYMKEESFKAEGRKESFIRLEKPLCVPDCIG